MQYIHFGNSGMQVSRFCLGTMAFGKQIGLEDSRLIVDEAIDRGVNFIDTADSYPGSEEMLGKILSPQKRERLYIATKVYRRHTRDKKVGRNSRVNIINQLERSLRLLQTDYVDLYQLHHPDPTTPLDETLDTLDNLVRQGKIRYWGVSNHYAWQMGYMLGTCHARRLNPLISVQTSYSMVNPQLEQEIVPMSRRFNVAVMCYGPLGGGILTGKYHGENGEVTPPENARFSGKRGKKLLYDDEIIKIVQANRRAAQDNDLQMNQCAILWLKSKPHVTTIILGGSKPEHFSSMYEVADMQLPDETLEKLDEAASYRIFSPPVNQPRKSGFRLKGQAE